MSALSRFDYFPKHILHCRHTCFLLSLAVSIKTSAPVGAEVLSEIAVGAVRETRAGAFATCYMMLK